MGRCELLWVAVNVLWASLRWCGWVGHFYGSAWVGVGRCDLFRGRYGTVWVAVTFLWVGVGQSGSMWLGLGQSGK